MWQNRFDSRLELEPTPSRYLLIYLALVHGLALLALWQPLVMPVWLQLMLAMAVMLSLAWWLRGVYRDSRQSRRLIWRTDGQWDYQDDSHDFEFATLLPDSYITRFLIVLHLQPLQGKAVRLVLLPDMIAKEQWHRLWLRLKYVDFDVLDS